MKNEHSGALNAKKSRQKGAATLLVTMVFLFTTAIVTLYLNRNILFAQKVSANQYRSTQALEMAEAGIEWATGMLNSPDVITNTCELPSTISGEISFRQTYVQSTWFTNTSTSTNVVPLTTTFPGCKVNGSVYTCSCPTFGAASLGTTELPGFTLAFEATTDVEAVRVTSTGCTAQTKDPVDPTIPFACMPGSANSDSTATVSVILKIAPSLRAAPAAPLSCGGICDLGGSYNLTNTDVATGGVLANAGAGITGTGGTNTTIPGLPPDNAMIANDASLATIASYDPTCSDSNMFKEYFGSTIEQYKETPDVLPVPDCGISAAACANALNPLIVKGKSSFFFPNGFIWNNAAGTTLGSVSKPVTLVSNAGFDINGNVDIYGMLFANDASFQDLGSGNATVHGALVTCRDFNSNGNGTLTYDADVLKAVRRSTGTMARVPGSWSDRCKLDTSSPPVFSCD